MAAPFVAAPFTGGASLAAIGAGAGAGLAAANHKGLGGIITGGALGAIPGVGKVASASKGITSMAGGIPSLGVSNGLPSGLLAQAGNSAPGGFMGILAKLKSAGIDPTALGLGTLSAFAGGDEGPQHMQSFAKGSGGQITNPTQALFNFLNGTNNFGMGINNLLQQGAHTPSSFVNSPGPAPVRIPGLNFQIGGGLATDPALKDPTLLNKPFEGDMYSSILPKGAQNNVGSSAVPKRRSPTSGGGQ